MPASFKQRVQKLQWLRRRAAHTHAKHQGLSKKFLRNKQRAANHAKRVWLRTRSKRTLYVRLQRRHLQKTKMSRLKAWQQGLRFATWNSRGLGAPSGKYPPELKVKCFIRRMQIQQWGCVVLTDVKGTTGTREFWYEGRSWTLVTRGRIGFLLEDVWADWWRQGGSITYSLSDRTCGIQFPRQGWRRGLFLVGVYAPTSDANMGERQTLRSQVADVIRMAQPTSISVVLGDLNAELGNNHDPHEQGSSVMGSFGAPRVTTSGLEWRSWAEREGFIHCHSRFQRRLRWSWRHPRFLSCHELDHIFLQSSCQWHLVRCRILHEGPSVQWPWSDYTDHNPVELCLRHGKLWRPPSSPSPSLHKPDVQKLRGHTPEAESLRQRWQTRVEEQLQRYRDAHAHTTPHETWEQICLICRNTAAQVCGIVSQSYDKPWLRGREENIQLLDQIIAQARRADHQARLNLDGLPPDHHAHLCRRSRLTLRQARKNKQDVITTWEEEWMNTKASLADQAAAQGRMGTVCNIIRELSNAKDHHRKFGLRRSEDPTAEAEAWKEHFKEIQAGVGDIPEHVWHDVAPGPELADWLSAPPTWEEFRKSINDMASGKAPGSDLFMTEYLKFAGDVLLKEVFSVVTSVWQQASSADSPNKAMTWPQSWQQGIIFPLWKRKGDRHNKNTWRGITLLSVGSKLVARICAARLQRWVQPWLNPFQFGFRKGSGVDDVQQVTRNILEEAAGSVHDSVVAFL